MSWRMWVLMYSEWLQHVKIKVWDLNYEQSPTIY